MKDNARKLLVREILKTLHPLFASIRGKLLPLLLTAFIPLPIIHAICTYDRFQIERANGLQAQIRKVLRKDFSDSMR